MLIFGERHLRHVLAGYADHTTGGGRIERWGCGRRAQHLRFPRPSVAGSGVDRSWAASSTSTKRQPEAAGRRRGKVLEPHRFAIGATTVFRYVREALDVLAALAPTLADATQVAAGEAFVILDGTLLPIDQVGMATGRDRPYYSGKHKQHGVNVQVLADPVGRLIWASAALPGARHDMGAAREHGLIDALHAAEVRVIADNGYRGSGFAVPQRRRPSDPETGRRRLSRNQREVNAAHARQRGPGERANAQLKSWRVLRKIRCCPRRATTLVKAVLVLILAG